jgi:hypothetical protein
MRQIVDPALGGSDERRYLTVMTVENGAEARPVQIQQRIDPQQ